MRPPTQMPRNRRAMSRRRLVVLAIVVILLVIIFSLRGIAGFYTDYLWFGSVHLGQTWRGIVGVKFGLAIVFSFICFLVLWVNLVIADRGIPELEMEGPEDELLMRYRSTVGRHTRVVHLIASILVGLAVGTGASGEWNDWILFRNSVSFGGRDPQFHKPIEFFVFKLPFINFVIRWSLLALIVITIITAIAHYLNGGIRIQSTGRRVSSRVKAHLSVLLALMALLKAVGYYYQRFALDTSTRGFREGASYTDVHAQLPALNLLILISLAACVIFLLNIRRQGWALPATGLGLWLLISLVVGVLYPTLIQTFKVNPAQNVLELPYIARNIAATRTAMNFNTVSQQSFPPTGAGNYSDNATSDELAEYAQSLSSAQLWDPQQALPTFEKLQDIRSYYQFNNLSVDRYMIGGQLTPVVIGVRNLNQGQLPATSWVNEHLQYTHGYGAALAPGNQVASDGSPVFQLSDLPPVSQSGLPTLTPQGASVYFGINMQGYVIANSQQAEIDYQTPQGSNVTTHYQGQGGVKLSSFIRKLAFSLRFGDIKPLISSQVTSNSRIMWIRNVQDLVSKAAPFLQLDSDPYPFIMNGRIYWVQDAYTTSSNYPYGQAADASALNQNQASGLSGLGFNYVRNSVKVLIDAYEGQMKFFIVDPHDPIVQAYNKAFPGMFTPFSQMPQTMREHLRYPEDLLTVQATMYGLYHITNPLNFYQQGDAWNISQDPGSGNPANLLQAQISTNAQGQQVQGPLQRIPPVYQVLQIPGQQSLSFTNLIPFVPVSQNDQTQNLTAFMYGLWDSSGNPQLDVFVTPRGQVIDGPALVDARMQSNSEISQQFTLLNQQGSQVLLGRVLSIPLGNTIIYVIPVYVSSTKNPLPQLQKVIVVTGKHAAIDNTLQAALAKVLGNTATVPNLGPATGSGTGGTSGPGSISPQVQKFLAAAQADYQNAQTALAAGNLGAYQQDVNQMYTDLNQAAQAAGLPAAPPAAGPPASTAPASGASSTTTTGAPAPTTTSGAGSTAAAAAPPTSAGGGARPAGAARGHSGR